MFEGLTTLSGSISTLTIPKNLFLSDQIFENAYLNQYLNLILNSIFYGLRLLDEVLATVFFLAGYRDVGGKNYSEMQRCKYICNYLSNPKQNSPCLNFQLIRFFVECIPKEMIN